MDIRRRELQNSEELKKSPSTIFPVPNAPRGSSVFKTSTALSFEPIALKVSLWPEFAHFLSSKSAQIGLIGCLEVPLARYCPAKL